MPYDGEPGVVGSNSILSTRRGSLDGRGGSSHGSCRRRPQPMCCSTYSSPATKDSGTGEAHDELSLRRPLSGSLVGGDFDVREACPAAL